MEVAMKYQVILACSALLATAAVAGDDPRSKEGSAETFKTLDADGDGKISKTEATADASIANNFESLDGDSDGFVSKSEFKRNTMPKPKPGY
jgi:Ca2+-binding EF-hand superfamily protein